MPYLATPAAAATATTAALEALVLLAASPARQLLHPPTASAALLLPSTPLLVCVCRHGCHAFSGGVVPGSCVNSAEV